MTTPCTPQKSILLRDRATGLSMSFVPGAKAVLDSSQTPWRSLRLERYHLGDTERPEASSNNYLASVCLSGCYRTEYLSGAGRPGFKVDCRPGNVFLVGPGDIPARRSVGVLGFLVIEVSPAIFGKAAGEAGMGGFEIQPLWAAHDPKLQSIIRALHHELLQQCPFGPMFADHMALSFASLVLTKYSTMYNRFVQHQTKLSPLEERRTAELLNDSLSDNLSLWDLAGLLEMPPSQLTEGFKRSSGLYPHEYLVRRRIEWALQRLKAPHPNSKKMISELGFSSAAQFSSAFSKVVGLSPRTYRDHALPSVHRVGRTPNQSKALPGDSYEEWENAFRSS